MVRQKLHQELRVLALLAALCFGASLLFAATTAYAAPYWTTQPHASSVYTSNRPMAAYTTTPSLDYYPFPSPMACYMHYDGGFYDPNCVYGFPAGILSAFVSGTSNGTVTWGKYGNYGWTPCNPGPYVSGIGSAGTAQFLVVAPGAQVQLEWACQPKQYTMQYLACSDGWRYPLADPIYTSSYVTDSLGNTYQPSAASVTVSQTACGNGCVSPTANTAGLVGSATVTSPSTPGTTVNYYLYCSVGGTPTLNATVPVYATTANLSLTSNSPVQSGTSATLTFSAGNVAGRTCKVTDPSGATLWSDTTSPQSTFTATGADQTWTVPAGVTNAWVKMWGAGGSGAYAGAGGYTETILPVSAGNYTVIVGKSSGGYGGGGNGSTFWGGGRSALRNPSGTEVLTAGGGGAGGTLGAGGAGGGLSGVNGGGAFSGTGGTQTAGGTNQSGAPSTYGSHFAGGGGTTGYPGAGGGSGWYGGAWALHNYYNNSDYGAGGGSGHCDPSLTNCSTTAGSGATPPFTNSADYVSGVGVNNGNGLVKIFSFFNIGSTQVSTGSITQSSEYTLSCSSPEGSVVSIKTTVSIAAPDSCPTYIETQAGNANGLLLYPGATRKVTQLGNNFCLTNYSASTYFIPAATSAELQSFINSVASLNVTKF